jgi:SAM-dependent methyltransferase
MNEEVVPILRTTDAAAAVEWYSRLGFVKRSEHRFGPGMPAFVEITRGRAKLFLSEHTGDARPDTLVYVRLPDVEALAAELGVEVEEAPWGREIELRDPDGNRLRIGTPRTAPPDVAALLAAFGLGDDDQAAWEASGLPPDAFEDWLTDRVARRPSGPRARDVYGGEDVHDFARRAILDALALGPGDRLLEIGSGGGLLLRDALRTGAAATGVDHSEEMVGLARERAPGADVVVADAAALPFPGGAFTAVAMSIVLMFLPEPVRVLRECRRVLAPGGRLAVYTTGPELRGTPAAPEPLAGRSHLYDDAALAGLARRAGFSDVAVARDGGAQLLTAVA